MYNPFKIFNRINIRSKFMLSYVMIIVFTVMMISTSNFILSESILKDNTMKHSSLFMEQLAQNITSRLKASEDLQFTNYKYSNLANLLRVRQNGSDIDQLNKTRGIRQALLDLLYSRSYLMGGVIIDEFGETWAIGMQKGSSVDQNSLETKINVAKIKESAGKAVWAYQEKGTLSMGRALIDISDTRVVGIIALSIDTGYLTALYDRIDPLQSGNIVLLDSDNRICVETDSFTERLVGDFASSGVFNRLGSNTETVNFEGQQFILSWVTVPESGLKLLNTISVADLTRHAQTLKLWIAVTCIAAILIAMVIATFISKTITGNIRVLVGRIKELSKGKFDVSILPRSQDEIGVLTVEFNRMTQKINVLLNEVIEAELLQKNAEFKALQFEYNALQSKMNPHFLYNTLETVNSIAKIKGEKEISEIVYRLGNLLRESISGKSNTIYLEKELGYVKNYLQIQKITYGGKFDLAFHIDETLARALVPKFILQPIVENAIMHGIEEKLGDGMIEINCYRDNGNVVFEVIDDGVGMSRETIGKLLDESGEEPPDGASHTRVGLRSVDKRIKILYGADHGVSISSVLGEGTKITIVIPLVMMEAAIPEEVKSNEI